MGFYPVNPADEDYVIGSPMFDEVKINLENGNVFVIKANNVSDKNIYIQKATLNGSELPHSYISHKDIEKGGELIFEMGENPNKKMWVNEKSYPKSDDLLLN